MMDLAAGYRNIGLAQNHCSILVVGLLRLLGPVPARGTSLRNITTQKNDSSLVTTSWISGHSEYFRYLDDVMILLELELDSQFTSLSGTYTTYRMMDLAVVGYRIIQLTQNQLCDYLTSMCR